MKRKSVETLASPNNAGYHETEGLLLSSTGNIPEEQFLTAPKQKLAKCSIVRFIGLFMVGIVGGLTMLVSGSVRFHYGERFGEDWWITVNLVILHVLVALIVISYLQTMLTDPGTVPRSWHLKIENSESLRNIYPRCRKSNIFKPPRSYYDSISRIVVLNFDHYCPWVNNSIGFFNRKFFIQFVTYTWLGCIQSALFLFPYGSSALGFSESSGNGRNLRRRRSHHRHSHQNSNLDEQKSTLGFFDLLDNEVGTIMSFVLCLAFSFTLVFFVGAHIVMAAKNTTSMQHSKESKRFDLGWRKNIEQVFGRHPLLWIFPVYGSGPVGDGVHWLTNDGYWEGLEEEAWVQYQDRKKQSESSASEDLNSV